MRNYILFLFSFCFVVSSKAVLTPMVDSIPMSDGKMIAADIYIPFGMTTGPVILIQTPYNRQVARFTGLPLGIGMDLNNSNYIFVITDWRGFYGSKSAAYVGSPNNSSDGYSNVEWIASQTWSNGKVGTWGPSALGKVQYQTAMKNPPHLVCINPSVAAPQFLYNEYYPNGALRTEYVEQLDGLGFGLTPVLMAHPYEDNTWNFIKSSNDYADSIKVPCFMVGGWYDHNVDLMMDYIVELKQKSFFSVRSKHKILMGPWVHGGNGVARVGTSTQGELIYANAEKRNDTMSLQFFDYYLRNINNAWESNPYYTYYQMGTNSWESSSDWPPVDVEPVKFYLYSNGTMLNNPPISSADSSSFIYDPSDPSPTVGGCTLRNDLLQGPYNQKTLVESRSDLIVFSSKILTNDVQLKGKIKVHLKVSSNKLDTDFDIRITDVYPDGRSMLVNDGVMRMRFREGFTQSQVKLMTPGIVYDCVIELPNTCITFLKGHQLRLIVSSSNYPKYNRNMNNGGNMYPGNSTDSIENYEIATNSIYTNSSNASYIELPLLNYISDIEKPIVIKKLLNIYPVPVNDELHLENKDFDNLGALKIKVFNGMGQLVYGINTESLPEFISTKNYARGVYFINVETKESIYKGQFVKY